jgi:DNA-binding NarL/FixJ family response regulator
MNPIRVLLADDHALVRAGIRSLLEAIEGVQVIAEAGDGHQALELANEHQPDLVLMDVAMPSLNGLEATARITKTLPHTRVIIVSMSANEEYVVHALRAGARGYLLKSAPPEELALAIRAVTRNQTYLTPAVSRTVVDDYLRRLEGSTSEFDRLTPRQREILQLIAEGETTKQIASRLKLSAKTVETHRQLLMRTLDIHDVAGLVRYAIRIGLTDPDR